MTRYTSSDNAIRDELRNCLQILSYPAFMHCAKRLLSEMGYEEIVIARKHGRGRNTDGGWDLKATIRTGITKTPVIAQVKTFGNVVQKRYVDELRGAMIRDSARQGILISLSPFSPVARQAAAAGQIAPVRLVDGSELIDLLIRHRVGVIPHQDGLAVDEGFFQTLVSKHQDTEAHHSEGLRYFHEGLRESSPVTRRRDKQSERQDSGGSVYSDPLEPQQGEDAYSFSEGGSMTWRTHALAGITTLWLLDILPTGLGRAGTWENIGVLAAIAAFGALLPDLDAARSKIRSLEVGGIRPFEPLGAIAYRTWGHRGFLHSAGGLALAGVLSVALSFWWGWQPSTALWLGYMSHLAADACTPSGIPALTPSRERWHLLPRPLRITTGSRAEDLLLPFLAAAVLALLLSHMTAPRL